MTTGTHEYKVKNFLEPSGIYGITVEQIGGRDDATLLCVTAAPGHDTVTVSLGVHGKAPYTILLPKSAWERVIQRIEEGQ